MRFFKARKLKPPKQLVPCRLEVMVKIYELFGNVKTIENEWKRFLVQTSNKDYPAWVAQIRGQIEEKIPQGFILEQATVQIFSKKAVDSSSN